MNYEEAVQFKSFIELPVKFDASNNMNDVLVTPDDFEDFKVYMSNYRIKETIDSTAKLYCSDGKYAVHGLFRNGSHLYYEKLSN